MNDQPEGQDRSHSFGYGKPPSSSRFRKGRSGNPKGRPRGSKAKELPFEVVLGRKVTIRDKGEERTVTAAEAFLLLVTKRGLSGGPRQTKFALRAVEQAHKSKEDSPNDTAIIFTIQLIARESLNSALIPLRMAVKLQRFTPSANMALEPWLVTAALARFENKRLTPEQQQAILQVTRSPHRVVWPDWWQALPPVKNEKRQRGSESDSVDIGLS